MKEKPIVSVVIPAYNEEKYLPDCLESLKKQDFDMNGVEIIVVDNNSTDNTAKVAEKYGARVVKEMKKGIGHARNAGFNNARAEIIANTDADTVVSKTWLRSIYNVLSKDDYDCVFGPISFRDRYSFEKKISYLFTAHLRVLLVHINKPILPGANFGYNRMAFKKVGGFKTNIDYVVELDFGRRLSRIGKIKFEKKMWARASSRRLDKAGFKETLTSVKAFLSYLFNKTFEKGFKDFR